MRERDVPQEGNATLDGHRKAVYAVADDGKVRLVASRGWEVEEIVKDLELRVPRLERGVSASLSSLPTRRCGS